MKTLILGLGNPIRGDDSIGLQIAETLQNRLKGKDITVLQSSAAGFDLLELLTGYEKAVIIDALQFKKGRVGKVYRFVIEELATIKGYVASPHTIDFTTAIDLGKQLGFVLPKDIVIIGIQIPEICQFSEKCTPQVENAIPKAVKIILKEISA